MKDSWKLINLVKFHPEKAKSAEQEQSPCSVQHFLSHLSKKGTYLQH